MSSETSNAQSASAQRVLDLWSSLAEKYSRRLDEDDIVDIYSGKIVKDRGVISSSGADWKFGCFMNLSDEEEEEEAPGRSNAGVAKSRDDGGVQDADDTPDELDAFASATEDEDDAQCAGDEEEIQLQASPSALRVQPLSPIAEPGPEDAADLAEFMEAEKRRRFELGDVDEVDVEEELDDEDEVVEELNDDPAEHEGQQTDLEDDNDGQYTESSRASDRSHSPEYDYDDEDDENAHEPASADLPPKAYDERPPDAFADDLDDDDFGNWSEDEGTYIYAVSEPDVIDLTDDNDSPAPAPELTTGTKAKGKQKQQKLESPPIQVQLTKPSPIKALSSPAVLQLHTPPRSTSSDPVQRPGKPKPGSSTLSRISSHGDDDCNEQDIPDLPTPSASSSPISRSPTHTAPRSKSVRPPDRRFVPEVVLVRRHLSISKHNSASQQPDRSADEQDSRGLTSPRHSPTPPRSTMRSKGKQVLRHTDGEEPRLYRRKEKVTASSPNGPLDESAWSDGGLEGRAEHAPSSHREDVDSGHRISCPSSKIPESDVENRVRSKSSRKRRRSSSVAANPESSSVAYDNNPVDSVGSLPQPRSRASSSRPREHIKNDEESDCEYLPFLDHIASSNSTAICRWVACWATFNFLAYRTTSLVTAIRTCAYKVSVG